MSKANPTALKVGMSGILMGRRYTVVGRVVLSMVADDGVTYYWNEFNVVDQNGASATLVYEEAEDDAPPWKWFTLLAPRKPLTAAEAAAKRVGDTIEFESRQIRITLVDETRVVHIEGQAPEDVEVGDVARYFNAEVGDGRLFVASWTGEDIEFYIGRPIKRRSVEMAFGLPRSLPGGDITSFGESMRSADFWILPSIIVSVVLFVLASNYERGGVAAEPPALRAAPVALMSVGQKLKVEGNEYEVLGATLVKIGEPRKRFQVREFALRGAQQKSAIVMHGWSGADQSWLWLEPINGDFFNDSVEAAKLKAGSLVRVGRDDFSVKSVFLAEVASREGAVPFVWGDDVQYALLAQHGDKWLFCRWSERGLRCYLGRAISRATLFGATP